jgi:hypothetical protein
MSNYNTFQLGLKKNSQPSHMKIHYNEKNVKFLGKKLIVLFSQCSNIVVKIRDIVRDKRKQKDEPCENHVLVL